MTELDKAYYETMSEIGDALSRLCSQFNVTLPKLRPYAETSRLEEARATLEYELKQQIERDERKDV